jgi:hypothetical protein
MASSLDNYIAVYETIDQEDDLEKLRNMAKYLLVGRAMNDPYLSEDQAIALAEYATMEFDQEEITIH